MDVFLLSSKPQFPFVPVILSSNGGREYVNDLLLTYKPRFKDLLFRFYLCVE